MSNNISGVFDFKSLPSFNDVAPPLSEFQARDCAALSYRFYDSTNKDRVVILLHGSSAHGEYLHALAEHLSSKKNIGQVYVPNLRGHYRSGDLRGDCDYIEQLEDDFYDLLDHFRLLDKKIYVIGHSSGGGLAIRLAGSPYADLIQGYGLLSPAIPMAPTMREGTAGGWAIVSVPKIIALSLLNLVGISFLNHLHVIQFNLPEECWNGKETLSYSFNLNTAYHPRYPYQNDVRALGNKFIVVVGSEDEANDPLLYPEVMQDPSGESIKVIEGAKHLDIVCNEQAMDAVASWIEKKDQ